MLYLWVLFVSLINLRLEMMPFIFILGLLLTEILLQLIDLRLDLNWLLCLLLLLHSNLILHVFSYIGDSPGLLLAFPPSLIPFLFNQFQQCTAPIHLSIHCLNDLLCLLDCLLLHLQLLLLVLAPLLNLHALLLFNLQPVQQVTLEHL